MVSRLSRQWVLELVWDRKCGGVGMPTRDKPVVAMALGHQSNTTGKPEPAVRRSPSDFSLTKRNQPTALKSPQRKPRQTPTAIEIFL